MLSRQRPLVGLLLLAALFQLLTMPSFDYRGDPYAPRAEATYWITHGEFGIPYAERELVQPLLGGRGEYMFENDEAGRLFSKYGIANTLLYLPPLFAEWLSAGRLTPLQTDRSLLFKIDLYQLAWFLVVATYLYRLAALYTDRETSRIGFVLASIYATMMWHYLRAPSKEIFQIAALLGMFYHAACHLRARSGKEPPIAAWRHLAYAALWAGSLSLMRGSFATVHLVMATLLLLMAGDGSGLVRRLRVNLTTHLGRYSLMLLAPSLLFAALLLWSNVYRFGSPWESGYLQWLDPNGQPRVEFSTAYLGQSIKLFLFAPGNGNLFIHYPLLLLTLFGWLEYRRRFPGDALLLLLVTLAFLPPILLYNMAHGEWCYGPRLLLPLLPLLALPAITAWDRLYRLDWGRWARGLVVAVLSLSVVLQLAMNSLEYFTWYDLQDYFGSYMPGPTAAYLEGAWHRGWIHADLIAYAWWDLAGHPLLEMVRPTVSTEGLEQVEGVLQQFAEPNYYWFGR